VQSTLGARERGGRYLDDFDAVKSFPQRLGEVTRDTAKGQVLPTGEGGNLGNVARNANNARKANEYGQTGDQSQSQEETEADLSI
jgi:hypothetical protein